MLNTQQKIELYDDTSSDNDVFSLSQILYEDAQIILARAYNEWYDDIHVMIYKKSGEVLSKDLRFYYAQNI